MSHNPQSFDLNLDDNPLADYQRLLINIRDMLWEARNQPQGFPREMPILVPEVVAPPPQQPVLPRVFDLRLYNTVASVMLRIRLDNLYVLGYGFYDRGGNFQWIEFSNGRRVHLIQDEQASQIRWLPFDGSYGQLEGASRDNEQRGEVSLSNVRLGLDPLQEAVESLFHNGRQEDSLHARRQIARSFVPVIVMTSECIRFYSVQGEVVRSFVRGTETTLSEQLQDRVHNWGDLSEVVLRFLCNINPDRISIPECTGLSDPNAVVNDLGAVKNMTRRMKERDGDDDHHKGRRPRSVDEEGEWTLEDGQPLVEILWVTVNCGENPCNLYGTIAVTDRLGSQFIYQRDSSNRQDVPLGQAIQLTGPSRCVSALDSFHIDIDLKDWDFFSRDDEVGRGRISWNVYDTISNVYNGPVAGSISGEDGSVSLNYVVLSNAVQAMVEITLAEGDDLFWDNVYGVIKATNKGGFEFDALLFDRESNDYVNVSSKEKFPLLRSAVPVQLNDSLIIQARLYDQDTLSRDDEIANGRATFPAQLNGITEQYITGSYGKIKVQVSWSGV